MPVQGYDVRTKVVEWSAASEWRAMISVQASHVDLPIVGSNVSTPGQYS